MTCKYFLLWIFFFIILFVPSGLVSWGCYNKWPQTGWCGPKTTEIYPCPVLEARSLKSGCQQGHTPCESHLCLPSFWWPQAFLGLWPHCSSLCLRLHIAFTISSVNPADSNSTACPGTDPSSPSPRLPGPRPPPSPARPLLWSPHQHPNRLRISPQLSSWATLLEPEEMQSLRPSNPPQGTLLSERRQSSCHGPRALQGAVRITLLCSSPAALFTPWPQTC